MPPNTNNNAIQHRRAGGGGTSSATGGELSITSNGSGGSGDDQGSPNSSAIMSNDPEDNNYHHHIISPLEIDDNQIEPLLLERKDENGLHHTISSTTTGGTASNIQVAFNIIISFVGAGMLGMPHAFSKSGWILGNVALAFVSAVNVYAMMLLVQCRQRLEKNMQQEEQQTENEDDKNNMITTTATSSSSLISGYGDVGRMILGPTGELVVNICLVISQVGFATAYIIFVAANAWKLAQIERGIVCLACIPILAILVQAREMKTLSPVSLIADIANFLALSTILMQDYQHIQEDNNNEDTEDNESAIITTANYSHLLYVVAISLYSLEGVGMILPLESSAKDRQYFPSLLKSVLIGITIFMGIFGTAGCMAFGNSTLAPITLNIQGNAGIFVQCSLCLALYLTYPIMMVPVHGVMEGIWPKLQTNSTLRICTRSFIVIFTAYIAYAVPDFGKFLSFVGSSICVLLGFIFPCYFHLKIFWSSSNVMQIGLNLFLIIGGIIFGMIGTYQSFVALFLNDDNGEGSSSGMAQHVRYVI